MVTLYVPTSLRIFPEPHAATNLKFRAPGLPTLTFFGLTSHIGLSYSLRAYLGEAILAGSFDHVTSLLAHHHPDWLSLPGLLVSDCKRSRLNNGRRVWHSNFTVTCGSCFSQRVDVGVAKT